MILLAHPTRNARRLTTSWLALALLLVAACRPALTQENAPAPRCYAFAAQLDTTQVAFQPRIGNPVHLPPRAARFDWTLIGPMTPHRRANPEMYLKQYRVVVPVDERNYRGAGNFWVPQGDSLWVVFGAWGFWYANLTFALSDTASLGRGHTVDDMGPKFGYDVRVVPTDCGAYEWATPRIDSLADLVR